MEMKKLIIGYFLIAPQRFPPEFSLHKAESIKNIGPPSCIYQNWWEKSFQFFKVFTLIVFEILLSFNVESSLFELNYLYKFLFM